MAGDRFRKVADRLRRTPFHPQWLLGSREAIRAELHLLGAGTVLDIGCADRWVQRHLREGCTYIALDYPGTGAAIYGSRPDVFADAAALPIAARSLDAVVALEVIEHVRDPAAAFAEISRVLRSGGKLLLSIPFLYPVHDAPHDYQRLTMHGLCRDVTQAGLHIERIAPNLGSAQTAGLIACISLAGMAREALQRRSFAMLLIPVIAILLPLTNLFWWACGKTLPSWPAVTAGYTLLARRP